LLALASTNVVESLWWHPAMGQSLSFLTYYYYTVNAVKHFQHTKVICNVMPCWAWVASPRVWLMLHPLLTGIRKVMKFLLNKGMKYLRLRGLIASGLRIFFYRYTIKWVSWPVESQCTTFLFFLQCFLKSRPLCDQTNKGVPVPSLPHFTDNNTTIHLFIPMLIIIMSFTFRMFECIEFSPFGPRIYIYIYGKGGTTFAKGDGIIKVRCYWELFG